MYKTISVIFPRSTLASSVNRSSGGVIPRSYALPSLGIFYRNNEVQNHPRCMSWMVIFAITPARLVRFPVLSEKLFVIFENEKLCTLYELKLLARKKGCIAWTRVLKRKDAERANGKLANKQGRWLLTSSRPHNIPTLMHRLEKWLQRLKYDQMLPSPIGI